MKNKVNLMGVVGMDPKVFGSDDNCVVAISVATSEKWRDKNTGEPKEKTEWHNIKAFRQQAKFVKDYVKKGHKVDIEGKLVYEHKEDEDGKNHKYAVIYVDRILLLSPINKDGDTKSHEVAEDEEDSKPAKPKKTTKKPSKKASEDRKADDDSDIPFDLPFPGNENNE